MQFMQELIAWSFVQNARELVWKIIFQRLLSRVFRQSRLRTWNTWKWCASRLDVVDWVLANRLAAGGNCLRTFWLIICSLDQVTNYLFQKYFCLDSCVNDFERWTMGAVLHLALCRNEEFWWESFNGWDLMRLYCRKSLNELDNRFRPIEWMCVWDAMDGWKLLFEYLIHWVDGLSDNGAFILGVFPFVFFVILWFLQQAKSINIFFFSDRVNFSVSHCLFSFDLVKFQHPFLKFFTFFVIRLLTSRQRV